MTDDDPIDLVQVGADDAALDAVRAGRVADDLALLLLRDLLDDVSEEIAPVPVGCGSTVLALASDRTPERRTVRNGTLVAALTAGLLSLSGVAAASTLAPDGSPLAGLGDAVRSAVGAAVDSVTPPDPVVRPSAAPPVEAPAVRAAPPAGTAPAPAGAAVSATARSQAAAGQVSALLDAAAGMLREGRPQAASARLDTAERRLVDVLPAAGAPLAERLADLREQVAAAAAPAQKPAPRRQAPAPREQAPQQQQKQPPKQQSRQDPPPKPEPAQEQPRRERQPSGKGNDGAPRGAGATAPSAPQVRNEVRGQLSRDASTNPRA